MSKRLLVTITTLFSLLLLTACNPSDPAQLKAWYNLNPEQGVNVTAETINEPQRKVVAHLEDQKEILLAAIAAHNAAQAQAARERSMDCLTAMRAVWPSHLWATGERVINRESGNTPTAQNSSSSAAGCWQMLAMHAHRFDAVGCSWARRYEALCNTRAAWHLYQAAGGWSPWRLTAY
jgi:hypothetical protein